MKPILNVNDYFKCKTSYLFLLYIQKFNSKLFFLMPLYLKVCPKLHGVRKKKKIKD